MSFVGSFFLLVVVVGSAELYLLLTVAAHMGLLATAALCVLTGIVGGALVRQQGLGTLRDIQAQLAGGELPAAPIASGLVLLIVGTMLMLPGFITDTFGFLLLVPALRRRAVAASLRYLRARAKTVIWPADGFGPGEEPAKARARPHVRV